MILQSNCLAGLPGSGGQLASGPYSSESVTVFWFVALAASKACPSQSSVSSLTQWLQYTVMILFCLIVQPSNNRFFCKVEHWAESWYALVLSCFQLDRSAVQLRVRGVCMLRPLPSHVTGLPSHAGRSVSTQASISLDIMQRWCFLCFSQGRPLSSCFWSALETEQLRWDMVYRLDTSGDKACLLCFLAFRKAVADNTLKLPGSNLMNSATYWWL